MPQIFRSPSRFEPDFTQIIQGRKKPEKYVIEKIKLIVYPDNGVFEHLSNSEGERISSHGNVNSFGVAAFTLMFIIFAKFYIFLALLLVIQ